MYGNVKVEDRMIREYFHKSFIEFITRITNKYPDVEIFCCKRLSCGIPDDLLVCADNTIVNAIDIEYNEYTDKIMPLINENDISLFAVPYEDYKGHYDLEYDVICRNGMFYVRNTHSLLELDAVIKKIKSNDKPYDIVDCNVSKGIIEDFITLTEKYKDIEITIMGSYDGGIKFSANARENVNINTEEFKKELNAIWASPDKYKLQDVRNIFSVSNGVDGMEGIIHFVNGECFIGKKYFKNQIMNW